MSTDQNRPGEGVSVAIDDVLDTRQPELPFGTSDPTNPAALASATAPEKDPVEEIKAQLETERKAREVEQQARLKLQAERDQIARIAIQREQEARQAAANAAGSQYDLIRNEIFNVQKEATSLEEKLQRAVDLGDAAAQAQLTRALSRLEQKLGWLEDGKAQMEAEAERAQREAQRRQQQPRQQQRPQNPNAAFEQRISHLTPATQAWLRQHPECVTDPQRSALAIRAHHVAEDAGLRPDTPEYFAFVEERLGYRKAASASNASDVEVEIQTARQTSPAQRYSAPPSRVPATGQPSRQTKHYLSPAEVAIARELNMTNEEYLQGKLAKQAERKAMGLS